MTRSLMLLFSIAFLPALSATVALKMDVERLTKKSILVVTAKVDSKESRWDAANKGIWTHHQLTVEDTLKGSADANQEFVTRGGVVGKIGQHVAGTGQFKTGERAVFFLWKDSAKRWRITGMAQGAFKIDGLTARNSVSGIKLVQGKTLEAVAKDDKHPLEFKLASLKVAITTAAEAAKKDDDE